MCGIVGYTGKALALSPVLEGLRRLEYRGYDSAGIAVIAGSLPLLWWRFRHTDREALEGIAVAMVVVVLFVPAALPWYYTWPLAVASALTQSRAAIALIAGFSTWIMVIFKPDGSHGMYSWLHVVLASACAVAAWYSLRREDSWRTV